MGSPRGVAIFLRKSTSKTLKSPEVLLPQHPAVLMQALFCDKAVLNSNVELLDTRLVKRHPHTAVSITRSPY